MIRKIAAAALLCGLAMSSARAQMTFDEGDKISHHIGFQVNPLLKQIVNFGNSPAIDNPFLVKYALRFNQSRSEILAGFGYRFTETSTENGLKSDLSDLSFRIGYAKKRMVGARFEVGLGLDLVWNAQNNQTINVQSFRNGGFLDSTISTTRSNANSLGGGPQITIGYYLTNRVKVGTEATFYFLAGINKLTLKELNYRTDPNGQIIETTNYQESENKTRDLQMQLPVALFLTIVL